MGRKSQYAWCNNNLGESLRAIYTANKAIKQWQDLYPLGNYRVVELTKCHGPEMTPSSKLTNITRYARFELFRSISRIFQTRRWKGVTTVLLQVTSDTDLVGLVSLEPAKDLGIPEGRLRALQSDIGPVLREEGDDDLDVAVWSG